MRPSRISYWLLAIGLAIGYWLSAIAVSAQAELGGREERGRPHFQDLDPSQKQALRDRYRQHQELSPQERQKIERQLQLWRELSPEQKQKLRRLNDQLQTNSPEQKIERLKRSERFMQLPPDQQKEALRGLAEGKREGQERRPLEMRQPSPEQQQQLFAQYPVWKDLSPVQQRTLHFMSQRVDSASPEAKPRLERWMEKFRQLPAERQKQMLDRISRRLSERSPRDGQGPAPRRPEDQRRRQGPPPGRVPGEVPPPSEDRPASL